MPDPASSLTLPDPMPEHPRLLASGADWRRLRGQVEHDGPSRLLFETLRRRAEAILSEPPLMRQMTGRMLLMVSRQALERISVLALVARVGGDYRFVERAAAEMRAVTGFVDWNPSHFLDTAEMALAVSLGYDWLFDLLDAGTRTAVEAALMEKAILPSLDEHAPSNWWLRADENWVQVCHGGLAAAAIAIADRHPETASDILQRALDRLPAVAERYAPDGAYPEGPMYWSYGTAYQVVLAAALERFTGFTHGVDAYPGFLESADYVRHVTAPSGDYFNYADCAARRRLQAQLFWMAGRADRPEWLEDDLRSLAADLAEYEASPGVQYWYYDMVALALLWHRPVSTDRPPDRGAVWHGRGPMPVVLYRWGEEDLYLGVKGGSVGLSHSHMDLGSFVFEAGGVRWAVDAGMQDYESLESAGVDLWNESEQSSQRWSVFRIGPESHNILRFDGGPQLLHHKAEIIESSRDRCVVDLSGVYAGVEVVTRVFEPTPSGFTMRDSWTASGGVVASAQWLTFARVERDRERLLLSQNGVRLNLTVSASTPINIVVDDVSQPAQASDWPNPNLTRIRMRCGSASQGWLKVVAELQVDRPAA